MEINFIASNNYTKQAMAFPVAGNESKHALINLAEAEYFCTVFDILCRSVTVHLREDGGRPLTLSRNPKSWFSAAVRIIKCHPIFALRTAIIWPLKHHPGGPPEMYQVSIDTHATCCTVPASGKWKQMSAYCDAIKPRVSFDCRSSSKPCPE